MNKDWLKRLLLIPIGILIYLGGITIINYLVRENLFPTTIMDSTVNPFIVANCLIFIVFLALLKIILRLRFDDIHDEHYKVPLYLTFVSLVVFKIIKNPREEYLLIYPIATVIFMIYLLYEYTGCNDERNDERKAYYFINKVLKLQESDSFWVFNPNGMLDVCETNGDVSVFHWRYNHHSRTLVLFKDTETRIYIVERQPKRHDTFLALTALPHSKLLKLDLHTT